MTPPRWTLGARTTAAIGGALGLLLVVAASAFLTLRSLSEAADWSRHTVQVLQQITQVSKHVVDAETGQRGYLLTGRTEYLEPFEQASTELGAEVARLRALVADDPGQQQRLAEVAPLLETKMAELRHTVMLRASRGLEPILALMERDHGKVTMDAIRGHLDEMAATERTILGERLAVRRTRQQRATSLLLLATGLAFALVAATTLALNAQGRRRLWAQARVAASEARLRVTLRSIGDAVVTTDVDGRVEFLNAAAEHLTGWHDAEVRGHPVADVLRIIRADSRTPLPLPADAGLAPGTVAGLPEPTLLVARDGREIPVEHSVAPIRDARSGVLGVAVVLRDVSERRRLDEERERTARLEAARAEAERGARALRVSEERYRSLVAASTDTVWTARPGLGLATPQPGWEAYTGQAPTEYAGLGWLRAVHPDDRDGVLGRWRAAEQARGLFEVEGRVWHAGARGFRHVRARAVPMLDADGGIREWVGMLEDIHERKQAELEREELLRIAERARGEAEEANQAKDEFLSVLSHELRSPLQTMITWIELVRRAGGDDPTLARAVTMVRESVRAQEQLIDDLLDVSRIVSGKLTLEVQSFDVVPTVAACVEQLRPSAGAKGLALEAPAADGALPGHGDPARVQQALRNVLHNAVKFTPRGGRIAVALTGDDDGVTVTVRDTGEGIAADVLPHVFDRFWQADRGKTRRHGGLGLGLAIARYLMEAQGGGLEAASDGPGRGAVFTLRLPRSTRAVAAAPTPTAPPGTHALAGVHVLLVDDDRSTREALALLLASYGATVVTAPSAADARAALATTAPDVLVSDVGMPQESGHTLVRGIRDAENDRRLPALAMTGFASHEDRAEALRAGFDAHVSKPVDPDALVACIVGLLGRSRAA